MPLTKRLRFEILRRDNHLCRYCGATAPDVKLTVDHVVPTALGGSDEPSNLVTACADCNSGKSASPPDTNHVDDVAQDALRWAAAISRVAEIDRRQRSDDSAFFDQFIDVMIAQCRAHDSYTIPKLDGALDKQDRKRSVLQFRDAGLDMDDLEYAIVKAMSNARLSPRHVWRYFCGVAWRIVEDRQKAAASLISEEDGNGN